MSGQNSSIASSMRLCTSFASTDASSSSSAKHCLISYSAKAGSAVLFRHRITLMLSSQEYITNTFMIRQSVHPVRLTHIESAPLAGTVEERLPTSKKGATAMKSHAIHYVALDVHQATTGGQRARRARAGCHAGNRAHRGSSAARSDPRVERAR